MARGARARHRALPGPEAGSLFPGRRRLREAGGFRYAIRLPANEKLQEAISYLLTRPMGRPPLKPQVFYESFRYWAHSWAKPRRVVAKVEWHRGEFFPWVGFIVTNPRRSAEAVVHFYNQRGTAEQWIREGKSAIRWTRLSCQRFQDNAVRLQLFALAYNLANFPGCSPCPKRGATGRSRPCGRNSSRSGPRSCGTGAISPSNWLRWPCREGCSPESWPSSGSFVPWSIPHDHGGVSEGEPVYRRSMSGERQNP